MKTLYHVSITCEQGCGKDETFEVMEAGEDSPVGVADIYTNANIHLPAFDNVVGLPVVGKVQEAIARLIGTLPQLEAVDPADQSAMTYVALAPLILIRDSILAHSYATCRVSITTPAEPE